MTALMLIIMVIFLLAGFPMMVPLLGATLGAFIFYLPDLSPQLIIQQMIGGVKPASLIAIPMFMFAADVITKGHSADRLLDLVLRFVGHQRGGLAVAVVNACGMFGAVSGSTQATVVAIGSPMRTKMLQAGYSDSFTIALAVNSAGLACLIPPSIGMIVFGVASGTSVSELFIAGIGPGLLLLLAFSCYSFFYAVRRNIPTVEKASWPERFSAMRRALWPAGFPAIVIGGIYGGIFSPTEAAAVCAIYAIILEVVIFRSIKPAELLGIARSTGMITSVVFILIAAGAAFSWVLAYAQIPQGIIQSFGLDGADPYTVLFAITLAFFIGCMFVDSIVVILVLTPIFMPLTVASGLDPVLVGVIVILQVAIGGATPPFGCDIFTATAVFRRPYIDCIRGSLPFFLLKIGAAVALIYFPPIALFLRDMVFR
ncbi:TRAP transporter large permease [Pseudomonas borbori]|uniref:TRAP transporter large permease protein n=1 Tax=Pseudomonas borbori TaxID=289003 RepID=A0A1I5MU36_9PSED|nr:TRAP transporter large permease [Pseudomonas borbori]SFP13035.1 TRAP transporter, DctM subunit [Pseudomonas borbori]